MTLVEGPRSRSPSRRATWRTASRTASSTRTRASSPSSSPRQRQLAEPLAASTTDPFSAAFVLPRPSSCRARRLHALVFRNRYIGRGMREDIIVHNFADEPAFCAMELDVGCDFADLFEVKEGRVEKIGDLSVQSAASASRSRTGAAVLRVATSTSRSRRSSRRPARVRGDRPTRRRLETCIQLTPVIDDEEITPRYLCGEPVERTTPVERLVEWRRRLPRRRATTTSSACCSTARPRTSPRCASSIPSTPTAPLSRPARRGS